MLKRFLAGLTVLSLLLSLLPVWSSAAEPAAGEPEPWSLVRSSDTEAAYGDVCWYVDSMNGNLLTASRLTEPAVSCAGSCEGDFEITTLSDWPADQLLYWEGELLVSAGNQLLSLDPQSGRTISRQSFAASVDRFARSPEALYVLSGGSVFRVGEEEKPILTGGVSQFWLEGPDSLCYMMDQQTIYTLTLSTGEVQDAPNNASDLRDVPACETADGVQTLGYYSLKQKFPHGKYWNHMPDRGCGMTYNNQDGWTEIPCPKHNGYCGTSLQTCNGYAPNGRELSYQCWGFADKLGHDASGFDPQNSANNGWDKLYYKDSLNDLKAGDILRYKKNDEHSIYVTAVSGDTITYADCNYDGSCIIRWDQTISKSTIRAGFIFRLSAPSTLHQENAYLLDVDALLDENEAETTSGWATFDVLINGAAFQTGVSEFREYLVKDSTYEIRNIKAKTGIFCDDSLCLSLSGTVTEDQQAVLRLDHYYLNSAGERVKTSFTDLPKPDHWSYPAICWAIENGVDAGVSETSFAPEAPCTRASTVRFLWITAGRPEPAGTELPFTDVSWDDDFRTAVIWALERGITGGTSETSFSPDNTCTRAEVMTFLWARAGRPEPTVDPATGKLNNPFRDVKKKDYFYKSVLWAVEQGITGGTTPTTFSPKKTCTKAEILTFLYAALRSEESQR